MPRSRRPSSTEIRPREDGKITPAPTAFGGPRLGSVMRCCAGVYRFVSREGVPVWIYNSGGTWNAKTGRRHLSVQCAKGNTVGEALDMLSASSKSIGISRIRIFHRNGHPYLYLGRLGLRGGGQGDAEEETEAVSSSYEDAAHRLVEAAKGGDLEGVMALIKDTSLVNAINSEGTSALVVAADAGHGDIVDALIERGADVNFESKKGYTPLVAATHKEHLEIVLSLLDNGANIDAETKVEWTPLRNAAFNGYRTIVEELIHRGASVDLATKDGVTALHNAAYNGHRSTVNALIQGDANIDFETKHGWTPLRCASSKGHASTVQTLIESGADVNFETKTGWTSLRSAAADGKREIVKTLTENGAVIDYETKNGWTALRSAAAEGHLEVVQDLIEAGADIQLETTSGWTALRAASAAGHRAVVQALIEGGAEINYKTKDGVTALHDAAYNGYREIVQDLIDNGAVVDLENTSWRIPLLDAVQQSDNDDIVEMLIEEGSDVEAMDSSGYTALHYCAAKDHVRCLKILIGRGADPNKYVADKLSRTPLHLAAKNGHIDIVRALLEVGAVPNLFDNERNTAADLATSENHRLISRMLEGAKPLTRTYSEALEALDEGMFFAKRYIIQARRIPGKHRIKFAHDSKLGQDVVLKFFESRQAYERELRVLDRLNTLYVCRKLGEIEEDGFPPCLVLEKAEHSLAECMRANTWSDLAKKACLQEILLCLDHLRKRDVVHCDLKPSNILFFLSTHSWKISDFEESRKAFESAPVSYTITYVSPEVLTANDEGTTEMVPEPSMDMWSFGIIAYEVLSGRRFYGQQVTAELVKEFLCRRSKPLPSLVCIEEHQARRLIENLLLFSSDRRWSARKALDNAIFKSADDTILKQAGVDKIANDVAKMIGTVVTQVNTHIDTRHEQIIEAVNTSRDITLRALHEIESANLTANIIVEEFRPPIDLNIAFELHECEQALMIKDDTLHQPVFVLRLNEAYRLRISLRHRYQTEEGMKRIKGVSLKLPNGRWAELETMPEGEEMLALLCPENHGFDGMQRRSRSWGKAEKKYVSLTLGIDLIGASTGDVMQLNGMIYCKMVSKRDKLAMHKAINSATELWKSCPQWIRSCARGAVFLANIASLA